jgi:hypothetical protein
MSRNFKFRYNLTRKTVIIYENQCIFLIISSSVLPRMRNISVKSCRENQNTHLMFNNTFFSKIVPFFFR